ncbi:GNAT family N-acetyltransferase [Aeromicrobium sp. Leaf350]|uniref:GNAT family N-acetyltransferase n=1 Tax=Aeromicrobium sp. Leaf350 TaxID=2876565 RepID=UPI001E2CD0F6|nr:GNAT family N-acetyltransferase [Aeromicrobium sp. Leaf350]
MTGASASGSGDTVRLAWPDDASTLATVQRQVWLSDGLFGVVDEAGLTEAFGDLDEHAERWRSTLTHSPEARFRVLVATHDDVVVGYGVLHPGSDPDADPVRDAELGDLAVVPGARRDGHGTRLVQAAADTAAADRFSILRTWVAGSDDGARLLLTSGGWASDGAFRELEAPDGRRIKQVRLHTAVA